MTTEAQSCFNFSILVDTQRRRQLHLLLLPFLLLLPLLLLLSFSAFLSLFSLLSEPVNVWRRRGSVAASCYLADPVDDVRAGDVIKCMRGGCVGRA